VYSFGRAAFLLLVEV